MSESHRRLPRWFWWVLGIFIGVPALLLALLIRLTEPRVDDPAALERFMSTAFTIPSEWITGPTASAELPAALDELVKAQEQCVPEALWGVDTDFALIKSSLEGGRMTPLDWEKLAHQLQKYKPFREALTRVLARPDNPGIHLDYFDPIGRDAYPMFSLDGNRFLRYQATYDMRRADWPAALGDAMGVYGLFVPHAPMVWTDYVEGSFTVPASRAVAAVAPACTDSMLLKRTLQSMGDVAPATALPDSSQLLVADAVLHIGFMRDIRETLRLPTTMTGRQLASEVVNHVFLSNDAGVRHTRWELLQGWWTFVSANPSALFTESLFESEIQVYTSELLGMHGRAVRAWAAQQLNFLTPGERVNPVPFIVARTRAAFDLARLALASRIEKLEGRPRPTRVEEFVPRYFPEPLLDPFSGKPFLYSASGEVFYSVGPDGVDDGMAQRCDPKEGVKAKGDYWLPPHDGEPWQGMWRE